MAYDKIIVIRKRLGKRLNYIMNPEKTTSESGAVLQAAINCQLETACADMKATKRRWDKTTGVLGYHIIHSFKPGEVTPEQAQALGMEFATRLLGDRFEAVVTTHTDHDHLHCHIVFNSVSFVDGKHYRNDFKAYFGEIRGISNEVSRENGLSVIEPNGKGQHYAEWNAEHSGKATVRGLIRQDIDAAIADAFTLQYKQLQTWADLYQSCTFEAKKMIVSRFIKSIYVYSDYRLEVEFNVSFEDFQRLAVEPEIAEKSHRPSESISA